MSSDARARLAEALTDAWVTGHPPPELMNRYAAALLPEVEAIADERAAEALREADQAGAGGDADDGQTIELGPVQVLRDGQWVDAVPAPSAGQDTERLRDELAETIFRKVWHIKSGRALRDEPQEWIDHFHMLADALLDGPLRQLIAEHDEARAQVQRVAHTARMFDDIAVSLEFDVSDRTADQYKANELGKAMGYRRAARDLRRALDNP